MATPATHRAQVKSLHKRGLLTDKQHDRMMARIEAMPVPVAPPADPNAPMTNGPGQGAPPAMNASVSTPGGEMSSDPTVPAKPPAM